MWASFAFQGAEWNRWPFF